MKIIINSDFKNDLIQNAIIAATRVGSRKAVCCNVYIENATGQEGDSEMTASSSAAPNRFNVCLFSARWSVSQNQYVLKVSNVFEDEIAAEVTNAATDALKSAVDETLVKSMESLQESIESDDDIDTETDED